MTRILVIMNLYPPHAYGGYEALCAAAVSNWRAAGHEVEVLTSDVRRPGIPTPPDEPGIHRVLPMYWDDHRLVHPTPAGRLAAERATRQRMLATLDEFAPDVVSVWNLAGLSFGILRYVARRDVPMVAVIGDRWLTFGPDLDAWSRMFTRRGRPGRIVGAAVQRTTGLHAVPPRHLDLTVLFASRHLADHALATSPFTFSRTEVVPHGVDLDAFPLAVDRADATWSGRLLVVSRIDPRKGLATLLRALASLPDHTLDVAGGGDERHLGELVDLARHLGVTERVRFLGPCDRGRVRELYLAADAVVFPSEWEEPFGIVPLEAMACGAPLVTTATGGSGEFLADGVNCLCYPVGDANALRVALLRVAGDPAMRDSLRRHGIATASRLSQQRTLATLEDQHVAAAAGKRSATQP